MTPPEESAYERGRRSAYQSLLADIIRELGYDTIDARKAKWIVEREDVVAALRAVCEDYGDNDWDETLSLADVIDKHLHRHLDDRNPDFK